MNKTCLQLGLTKMHSCTLVLVDLLQLFVISKTSLSYALFSDVISDAVQGVPKMAHFVLYVLTSSNIDRFSNLFHCHNQENICNNTVTKE